MKRIDILTLFPSMFDGFLNESIIKRAIENQKVQINIINFRDYTLDKHHNVDDTPFGGGAGMILKCEPIFNTIDAIKGENSRIIITSPRGKTYNQNKAKELLNEEHIIIICGHYEGFDERIYSLADDEISIGNFILTGGEIPSMAITDSIVRLIDGVISKDSLESESFDNNMLDYPVYTQPRVFRGMEVPEVLLNGNHKEINEYRKKEQLRITKEKRDDLL